MCTFVSFYRILSNFKWTIEFSCKTAGEMFRSAVCFILLALFLPTGEFLPSSRWEEGDPMLVMLDAMEEMFGGDQYDRDYYDQLMNCMTSADSGLVESQNGAWRGIIDYWKMDGVEDDSWGSKETNYREWEPTNTSVDGMIIFEPCDYTSNIAYYHDVTELCSRKEKFGYFIEDSYLTALIQGFSMMAMGSSFMHGSHTHLGGTLDNWSIKLTSYIMHQASLSSLGDDHPILTDFQSEHRNMTSIQLAQSVTDMFSTMNVTEWDEHIDDLDIPKSYYLIFSGLVCSVLTISFEPDVVDELVLELAELFGLEQAYLDFIMNEYLPELRSVTENLELPPEEHVKFIGNSVGSLFKLIYAFLFQEQVLQVSKDYFLCPFMNRVGWSVLPSFNVRMGQFMTFFYDETKFQFGEDIYPGEEECNPVIPHAKWHLESAIGMLDFAYLSDQIHKILLYFNN